MTPEGKVKAAVDKVLFEAHAYWHKPQGSLYGDPALDYHVSHRGLYAAIETKSDPSRHPTARQTITMKEVIISGGSVFLIDAISGVDLKELTSWLANPSVCFISSSVSQWLKASAHEQW